MIHGWTERSAGKDTCLQEWLPVCDPGNQFGKEISPPYCPLACRDDLRTTHAPSRYRHTHTCSCITKYM